MATFTEKDRKEAQRLWREYQDEHDLSGQQGSIAGIDPKTGRVWIGEWFDDVIAQRDADGINHLLVFERVGYSTTLKKL